MVRRMPFQKIDVIVDGIGQADMFSKLQHCSNASIVDGFGTLGELVLDYMGSENRIGI